MLTLLTTTGCRPEAWAICEKLMMAQDYTGAVRWVIVDDGERMQPVTFSRQGWKLEIIRPVPFWKHGQNTQARNILAGLDVISSKERLVLIEDDDYYRPEYLTAVDNWLNYADLVGESHARYFNCRNSHGKEIGNKEHASLCSTACIGAATEMLKRQTRRHHKFIDMKLWQAFRGSKKLYNTGMVVGIKGLPGRGGIGCGHRMESGEKMPLSKWLGDDAEMYSGYIHG